jgi:FtsH-like protein
MASDLRALCADCGHAWSWHDRDTARRADRSETGVERPCYRETGGAPCRCRGFRDSGEIAVAATIGPRPTGLFRNALLTLALVVLGLGMLYAYRAQTPAMQTVVLTQAIQEINSGQVKKVTIVTGANKATLELVSGDKHQTNLPDRDEVFQKALFDYNAANPSKQITIEYQQESQTFSVIGSIVLSLLPVFLIGGFFYYMMRQAQRR